MNQILRSMIMAALFINSASTVLAQTSVAGPFRLPYSENQTWTACSSVGWLPYGDPNGHQYFMEYYSEVGKYHMGEDWNGRCGGNTDAGAPLYAIADGHVSFVDHETVLGQGKRLHIRHSFPYAFGPNGLMTFDSIYWHLQEISDFSGVSAMAVGTQVSLGQPVAKLGNTGTTSAHLHWEARTDLTLSPGINPYISPLSKSHALKYRAPSLFVDDRRDIRIFRFAADGIYHAFNMQGDAPSSTIFVEVGTQRKSLKNAIAAGWISPAGMIHESNGSWYYYINVDDNFLLNGRRYAFRALVSGTSICIPVPRNGFQQDRARMDMIHAVENDQRFSNVLVETYSQDTTWDTSFTLHLMAFSLSSGGTAWVAQITSKSHPLVRYTSFSDPNTGSWSAWKWINWNRLY